MHTSDETLRMTPRLPVRPPPSSVRCAIPLAVPDLGRAKDFYCVVLGCVPMVCESAGLRPRPRSLCLWLVDAGFSIELIELAGDPAVETPGPLFVCLDGIDGNALLSRVHQAGGTAIGMSQNSEGRSLALFEDPFGRRISAELRERVERPTIC